MHLKSLDPLSVLAPGKLLKKLEEKNMSKGM